MSIDPSVFYGDYASSAATLLDEAADEDAAIVEAKFAAARHRLAQRVEGLDAEQRALVLGAIASASLGDSDHDESTTCPVCDQQGWTLCELEDVGDVQVEVDEDGAGGIAWVEQQAFSFAFVCAVCGLNLEGRELEAAGLPTHFEVEEAREVDLAELYDGEDY